MASRISHLWAVGYDSKRCADKLREELVGLAETHTALTIYDLAVLIVEANGSFKIDRRPFPGSGNIGSGGVLDYLAGIAAAAPMGIDGVDWLLGNNPGMSKDADIDEDFIEKVRTMLHPGSAALLVHADRGCNISEVLEVISGLGGTVLQSTANAERLQLIQLALNRGKS